MQRGEWADEGGGGARGWERWEAASFAAEPHAKGLYVKIGERSVEMGRGAGGGVQFALGLADYQRLTAAVPTVLPPRDGQEGGEALGLVGVEDIGGGGAHGLLLLRLRDASVRRFVTLPSKPTALLVLWERARLFHPLSALKGGLLCAVGTGQGELFVVHLGGDAAEDEAASSLLRPETLHLVQPPFNKGFKGARAAHGVSLLDETVEEGRLLIDDSLAIAQAEAPVKALHFTAHASLLFASFAHPSGACLAYSLRKRVVKFPLRVEGGWVGGFAVQEPENDPQASLYLWAAQPHGRFRIFQLRFEKKEEAGPEGVSVYKGLRGVGARFAMDVPGGGGRPIAVRVLSLPAEVAAVAHGAAAVERDSTGLPAPVDTTFALLLWQKPDGGFGGGLWSLNAWYLSRMTGGMAMCRLGSGLCPFLATFSLPREVPDAALFDAQLEPRSGVWSELGWLDRSNAVSFYPSSLSLNLRLLYAPNIRSVYVPGVQTALYGDLCSSPAGLGELLESEGLGAKVARLHRLGLLAPDSAVYSGKQERQAAVFRCLLSGSVEGGWGSVVPGAVLSSAWLREWAWRETERVKGLADGLAADLFRPGDAAAAAPVVHTQEWQMEWCRCVHLLGGLLSLHRALVGATELVALRRTALRHIAAWTRLVRLLYVHGFFYQQWPGLDRLLSSVAGSVMGRRAAAEAAGRRLFVDELGSAAQAGLGEVSSQFAGTLRYPFECPSEVAGVGLLNGVSAEAKAAALYYFALDAAEATPDDRQRAKVARMADEVEEGWVRPVGRYLASLVRGHWRRDRGEAERAGHFFRRALLQGCPRHLLPQEALAPVPVPQLGSPASRRCENPAIGYVEGLLAGRLRREPAFQPAPRPSVVLPKAPEALASTPQARVPVRKASQKPRPLPTLPASKAPLKRTNPWREQATSPLRQAKTPRVTGKRFAFVGEEDKDEAPPPMTESLANLSTFGASHGMDISGIAAADVDSLRSVLQSPAVPRRKQGRTSFLQPPSLLDLTSPVPGGSTVKATSSGSILKRRTKPFTNPVSPSFSDEKTHTLRFDLPSEDSVVMDESSGRETSSLSSSSASAASPPSSPPSSRAETHSEELTSVSQTPDSHMDITDDEDTLEEDEGKTIAQEPPAPQSSPAPVDSPKPRRSAQTPPAASPQDKRTQRYSLRSSPGPPGPSTAASQDAGGQDKSSAPQEGAVLQTPSQGDAEKTTTSERDFIFSPPTSLRKSGAEEAEASGTEAAMRTFVFSPPTQPQLPSQRASQRRRSVLAPPTVGNLDASLLRHSRRSSLATSSLADVSMESSAGNRTGRFLSGLLKAPTIGPIKRKEDVSSATLVEESIAEETMEAEVGPKTPQKEASPEPSFSFTPPRPISQPVDPIQEEEEDGDKSPLSFSPPRRMNESSASLGPAPMEISQSSSAETSMEETRRVIMTSRPSSPKKDPPRRSMALPPRQEPVLPPTFQQPLLKAGRRSSLAGGAGLRRRSTRLSTVPQLPPKPNQPASVSPASSDGSEEPTPGRGIVRVDSDIDFKVPPKPRQPKATKAAEKEKPAEEEPDNEKPAEEEPDEEQPAEEVPEEEVPEKKASPVKRATRASTPTRGRSSPVKQAPKSPAKDARKTSPAKASGSKSAEVPADPAPSTPPKRQTRAATPKRASPAKAKSSSPSAKSPSVIIPKARPPPLPKVSEEEAGPSTASEKPKTPRSAGRKAKAASVSPSKTPEKGPRASAKAASVSPQRHAPPNPAAKPRTAAGAPKGLRAGRRSTLTRPKTLAAIPEAPLTPRRSARLANTDDH